MLDHPQRSLIDLALAKGMISAVTAQIIITESQASGAEPLRLLVAHGHLLEHAAKVLYQEWSEREAMPIAVGNYRVVAKLGSGNMGVVYKAKQSSLHDRLVAIKVLLPLLVNDARFVERFHREAESLAQVADANVLQIIDVGCDNRLHYIVMEYLEGGDAERLRLANQGKLSINQALRIICDATRGVVALHRQNLIHRDIKPQNILLTAEGLAKIADLGLSRSQIGDHSALTEPGTIVGTPAFMAPEQALGEREQDIRCDIYSLGATLYTLVTGLIPFQDKQRTNSAPVTGPHIRVATGLRPMLAQVVKGPFPDPRETVPDFPNGLAAIIAKATARLREHRYQQPSELLADLLSYQANPDSFVAAPVLLQPQSWVETTVPTPIIASPIPVKSAWRQPLIWGTVAMVVVVGILLTTRFGNTESTVTGAVSVNGLTTQQQADALAAKMTGNYDRNESARLETEALQFIRAHPNQQLTQQIETALAEFRLRHQAEQRRLAVQWNDQYVRLQALIASCGDDSSNQFIATIDAAVISFRDDGSSKSRTEVESLRVGWDQRKRDISSVREQRRRATMQQAAQTLGNDIELAINKGELFQARVMLAAYPVYAQNAALADQLSQAERERWRAQIKAAARSAIASNDISGCTSALNSLYAGPIALANNSLDRDLLRLVQTAISSALDAAQADQAAAWVPIGVQLGMSNSENAEVAARLPAARLAGTIINSLQSLPGEIRTADPAYLRDCLSTWPPSYDAKRFPVVRQARARLMAEQLRTAIRPKPVKFKVVHHDRDYSSSGVIGWSDGSETTIAPVRWSQTGALFDPAPAKQTIQAQMESTLSTWRVDDLSLRPLRDELRLWDQETWYKSLLEASP
jgi:serine/threonine protein kinase